MLLIKATYLLKFILILAGVSMVDSNYLWLTGL